MFRVSTTPIIRSTQNCNYSLRYCAVTSLQRGQAWPRWREVAALKIWPVPEAVVTVLCTPDDGCGWHPKHVEWTCRIINRLLCVASRWTIINIRCHCLTVFSIYVVYCVGFTAMNSLVCQRRTQRGRRRDAGLPHVELKKTCCKQDAIKCLVWFTLQPKRASEMIRGPVH